MKPSFLLLTGAAVSTVSALPLKDSMAHCHLNETLTQEAAKVSAETVDGLLNGTHAHVVGRDLLGEIKEVIAKHEHENETAVTSPVAVHKKPAKHTGWPWIFNLSNPFNLTKPERHHGEQHHLNGTAVRHGKKHANHTGEHWVFNFFNLTDGHYPKSHVIPHFLNNTAAHHGHGKEHANHTAEGHHSNPHHEHPFFSEGHHGKPKPNVTRGHGFHESHVVEKLNSRGLNSTTGKTNTTAEHKDMSKELKDFLNLIGHRPLDSPGLHSRDLNSTSEQARIDMAHSIIISALAQGNSKVAAVILEHITAFEKNATTIAHGHNITHPHPHHLVTRSTPEEEKKSKYEEIKNMFKDAERAAEDFGKSLFKGALSDSGDAAAEKNSTAATSSMTSTAAAEKTASAAESKITSAPAEKTTASSSTTTTAVQSKETTKATVPFPFSFIHKNATLSLPYKVNTTYIKGEAENKIEVVVDDVEDEFEEVEDKVEEVAEKSKKPEHETKDVHNVPSIPAPKKIVTDLIDSTKDHQKKEPVADKREDSKKDEEEKEDEE